MYKASKSLEKQLIPGEHLMVAVAGQMGPSVVSTIFMGWAAASDLHQLHIGITEHDLVRVEFDKWGKPTELRRSPLSQVKLVEFKEGLLTDEVVIDLGETKPIRVRVSRLMRQGTQELVAILSSDRWRAAEIKMTNLSGNHKELPVQTPFWQLFLLGTGTAILGNVIGWLLSGFLVASLTSADFVEGYGYLAALLCWVVGLPGSLAFGLLAAWLGLVASRSHPNRIKNTTALLGFSLGVATWVAIGMLAIILERMTA